MPSERAADNDADPSELRSAVAVAMRLRVRELTGKAVGWYSVLSTLAVIYLRAAWPFAIGVALVACTYWLLLRACVRRVQLRTGLSPATQAVLVRRYKVDAKFARAVDRLDVRTSSGNP